MLVVFNNWYLQHGERTIQCNMQYLASTFRFPYSLVSSAFKHSDHYEFQFIIHQEALSLKH